MDDKVYLNSKEGFLKAYESGCRLFEVDLAETSDGTWVCRHTWKQSLGQWKGDAKKVLTEKKFCAAPLYGKYTPMTFRDLAELLKDYPDAYILIDAKKYSSRNYDNTVADYGTYLEIAREAAGEEVLAQIIPEIYNESMFEGAASVYPFTSYMYSLWQEYTIEEMEKIADFCKEKGIPAVTVNYQHWTTEVQKLFEKRGLTVFLYTLNDLEKAKVFVKEGVAGFCTDTMKETDFVTV